MLLPLLVLLSLLLWRLRAEDTTHATRIRLEAPICILAPTGMIKAEVISLLNG